MLLLYGTVISGCLRGVPSFQCFHLTGDVIRSTTVVPPTVDLFSQRWLIGLAGGTYECYSAI